MSQAPSESGRLFTTPAGDGGGELDTVTGAIDAITYRNEGNGYTVARFRTLERDSISVVGTLHETIPGEMLQLWGKWETHRQYGQQFRIVRYQVQRPATPTAIERYLGSGMIHGIGAGTAKKLVKYFGADTLDVIDHSPERLTEAPGIGKQTASKILEGWEAHREVRHIMLFLQGHGVSATYAMKIYKTYGDQSVEIVSANPYRLAQDVFGIGFKMADRIARQLGLGENMPERIEAGVLYCLQQAGEQGHCYLPEEQLAKTAADLLAAPPEEGAPPTAPPTPAEMREAIDRLVRVRHLTRDASHDAEPAVYRTVVFHTERQLAARLRQLAQLPFTAIPTGVDNVVDKLCEGMGITLAEQQRRAVYEALRSRILILTGGPGTGKTTTTRAILQALQEQQRTVLLASPTGRAAKRLSEVTGQPALTIHRLLEVDPSTFKFRRCAGNPLECQTLIVDEVSMLDLALAHALVSALPEQAQLILVGDADQLPSVGAGNVLHDLIASEAAPVVRLTEVFRQAAESAIITNAHRINHGEMPALTPTTHWQHSDCLFIPQDDPLLAAQKIADVVSRSLPSLGYTPEQIQVLTPMQRGTLGAVALNEQLQAALNPKQLGVAEYTRGMKTLRCGDRVIQSVNNYTLEVFNGDIGYIHHIDSEERALVVAYPERDVIYTFDEADELLPAYALTVHKSQGSEYPAVVIALHTQHYLLLQRNLLYTALTRAKKMVILIGSKKAVAIAVQNARGHTRFTRLADRLLAEDEDEVLVLE